MEKLRLAMDKMTKKAVLTLGQDHRLAYYQSEAIGAGTTMPGIIFLGGFRSDMEGKKALYLEKMAQSLGLAFVRFDYFGHGASSGDFEKGTIGLWRDDVLHVLDRLTQGPQILVGSSMGGWLMILAALARPKRIAALIGIAAAPDCTERLVWNELTPGERQMLAKEGRLIVPSTYSDNPLIFTRTLIEEGRKHLVLDHPIALSCPVRLLHGMVDSDVPYALSMELAQRIVGEDCRVSLIKSGDHRLSREDDLLHLRSTIIDLLPRR